MRSIRWYVPAAIAAIAVCVPISLAVAQGGGAPPGPGFGQGPGGGQGGGPGGGQGRPPMGGGGGSAMVADDTSLYIVQGNRVFKLSKGNLAVTGQATLPMQPPGGPGGGGPPPTEESKK